MRKVTLYIATSEDGFIADESGSVDFLNPMHVEGEDYGYGAFLEGIDTVVVGRKTYQSVLDMGYDYPHTECEVVVFTRTPRPALGNLTFHAGSPVERVRAMKSLPDKKGIYCEGGAEIAHQLLTAGLIDEIILSIAPTKLGRGVELFPGGGLPKGWVARMQQRFESGLVQLHGFPA
jgi:dihydrofolate reductase